MDTSNGYLNGLSKQTTFPPITPVPICKLDTSKNNKKTFVDKTYILVQKGENNLCDCGNNGGVIKYPTILSPPNSTNTIYGCSIDNNK